MDNPAAAHEEVSVDPWRVTLTEGHILLTNLIMSECVLSVKSSGASST